MVVPLVQLAAASLAVKVPIPTAHRKVAVKAVVSAVVSGMATAPHPAACWATTRVARSAAPVSIVAMAAVTTPVALKAVSPIPCAPQWATSAATVCRVPVRMPSVALVAAVVAAAAVVKKASVRI